VRQERKEKENEKEHSDEDALQARRDTPKQRFAQHADQDTLKSHNQTYGKDSAQEYGRQVRANMTEIPW
jgi:hypothetical protein